MSHGGQENQGTGLRDIFDILVKAHPERLQSLTFQLSNSPEDNIIHALCLIVLQREVQALDKLQMLTDNYLAKHLAGKWQMSGGNLEDFATHCGSFQEITGEYLAVLARIFKVLSEQKLCDPLLRNLAYMRALSSDNHKTTGSEHLEYDQFREEAKDVCGPQLAEWMCSSMDLKSGSYHDPYGSLDEGNTTLKVTLSQDQSERAPSLPSPLQASSSMPSYPTHLEISIPPTASFQDGKRHPERSDEYRLNKPTLLVSECAQSAPVQSQTSEEPQPKSNEPPVFEAKTHSEMDKTLAVMSSKSDSLIVPNKTQTQITKPTTEPKFALPTATNIFPPKMPVPHEMHESNDAEEEEQAIFYAFVIMHAPEDADMAESMKEQLESVIRSEGSTLPVDFAIPGKSTLRCVEDAINNTAFTFLLLTRNFNTPMQEMEANSALINSINNKHKYNTVIPLLPRENCMPRQSIPLPLQTIVPLEENRSFERKIQKTLSPARIEKQRKMWAKEQEVKMQIERTERLKRINQHQKQLNIEYRTAQLLERENLCLLMERNRLCSGVPPEQDGGDSRAWWPQRPNIHIENAKYIMIGNDSQMTVGMDGGADEEDLVYREEEEEEEEKKQQ